MSSGSNQSQGILFERYKIHRLLDVGGMAEVYLASVTGPGGFEKPVVIKRVKPEYADDETFVQMFIDEARISATLDHANIVRVYDFGQSGKHYYLALELIDGVDLHALSEWLQENERERVGWQTATIILREVLAGLEHAHQQLGSDGQPLGIIHRDIDPNNIMIRRDGAVKILDFGCAKADKSIRNTETTVGIIKGKMGYMSPEQAFDKPLDARTDVFSASIVFHELLTGQQLFDGANPIALLASVRNQPIPEPRKSDSKIPRALSRIVMRGLARDRDQRYSSAGEMLEDLDGIFHKYRLKIAPLRELLRKVMADRDAKVVDSAEEWQRTSRVWSGQDTAAPAPPLTAGPAPSPPPVVAHVPPPVGAPEALDAKSGEITSKQAPSSGYGDAPPVDEAAATTISENPLWMLEEHMTTQETTAPLPSRDEAPSLVQQFGTENLAGLETKILPPDSPMGNPTTRPRAPAAAPDAPGASQSPLLPPDAVLPTDAASPLEAPVLPVTAPKHLQPTDAPPKPKRRLLKIVLALAAIGVAVTVVLILYWQRLGGSR